MTQTDYSEDQAIGLAGQLADSGRKDVISRSAEETIVPFGRMVVLGTDPDKQAKLPSLAADITDPLKVLGATLHSHAGEAIKGELSGYRNEDSMSILHQGRLYMEAEQPMTAESQVWVRFAGKKQEQTLDWDADFVSGNTIDGKVNGAAIASVPFNTDQATTLADVATAIQNAHHDVLSASATGARQITVVSVSDKNVLLSDFTVTGGASQAVESIVETVALVPESDRGKIRADADNTTAELLAGARILKSASAGGLAVLELNL